MSKEARVRAAKAGALARWPIPNPNIAIAPLLRPIQDEIDKFVAAQNDPRPAIERCSCAESEHLRAALCALLKGNLSREDAILVIGRALLLQPLR